MVTELLNLRNGQSPVSVCQWVRESRSSVQEMLTHLKSHLAFTGPWKAKIDQYYMHAVSCDIVQKKCDNDIYTIFWKWYDIRYHDISSNDMFITGSNFKTCCSQKNFYMKVTGRQKSKHMNNEHLMICINNTKLIY